LFWLLGKIPPILYYVPHAENLVMAYFRLVSKSWNGDHPTPLEKYFLKQVADTDARKEVGTVELL
jgi:hypothetical protein